MKKIKSPFGIVMMLMLFLNNFNIIAQINEKPVEIGKSIEFKSKILNETRTIQIYLPQSYSNNLYNYPVFYVTDGEDNFQNAISVVKGQSNYMQHIPEMIIVAISSANRSKIYSIMDGGANKTLDFIKDELSPYIDSVYRTERFRILFGHSLTGAFSFYSLSKYPDLFNAFIILSPSMHHKLCQPATPALKNFLDTPNKMKKILYVGISEGDNDKHQKSFQTLDSLFKTKAPKTFDYKFEKLADEDHWSEPLIGIYKGLKYIYKTWKIPNNVVDEADVDLLKKHINSLSTIYGYKVKYNEAILGFIGMEFLEPEAIHPVSPEKMKSSAKEIFEINIENFPKSSDAYFYLGYYYMSIGDKENAIKNFEKSIELNPNNQKVKYMLAKLKG